MTSINTAISTVGLTGDQSQSATTLNQSYDDFLTLLTTQLQYQDPLEPTDTSEFTNQLVQFSQVEQQINMNQKLDNLLGATTDALSRSALGYIGLDVEYIGSNFSYDGAGEQTLSYDLGSAATDVEIRITDSTGATVRQLDGPVSSGTNTITWDGRSSGGRDLPAGTYNIIVNATDNRGEQVNSSTRVHGLVDGIEQFNGVTNLRIGDVIVPESEVIAAKPG
ncbi:MAG: flagellar hook assembly protein FlgD [Alphaproteobacteria bacterium]